LIIILGNFVAERYLLPGSRLDQWFFTWQQKQNYFQKFYSQAAIAYEKHNAFVKSVVPPERLLIWNVNEGWEPLCRFLKKPIPEQLFPHCNKTGDTKWAQDYINESNLGQELKEQFNWNCRKLIAKAIFFSGAAFYIRRNLGKPILLGAPFAPYLSIMKFPSLNELYAAKSQHLCVLLIFLTPYVLFS